MTRYYDYWMILETLNLLRCFAEIGIYDAVVGDAEEISEGDYYEFELSGLENVAPIFSRLEVGSGSCSGGVDEDDMDDIDDIGDADDTYANLPCCTGCAHPVYLLSSPEMREYYRLCRLYEHREGIEPKNNPYVKAADDYYTKEIQMCSEYCDADFDDNRHTRNLFIEMCPERSYEIREIIGLIHKMLEYYKNNVEELEREIYLGKPAWLPALPAHEGGGSL